eukprot:2143524-Rhodomonas_salina.1
MGMHCELWLDQPEGVGPGHAHFFFKSDQYRVPGYVQSFYCSARALAVLGCDKMIKAKFVLEPELEPTEWTQDSSGQSGLTWLLR